MKKHYFYDQVIFPQKEQNYIEKLLRKYRKREVNDELKQEIWDELQKEKARGHITIPFKIVTRRDPSGKFSEYIEVILDTKV